MKRIKIAFEVHDMDHPNPRTPIFEKRQIIIEFEFDKSLARDQLEAAMVAIRLQLQPQLFDYLRRNE